MHTNQITPTGLCFRYDPKVNEFVIFVGLKFVSMENPPKFAIDINPHMERELVEIYSLRANANYQGLVLEVDYEGENEKTIIESTGYSSSYLMKTIVGMMKEEKLWDFGDSKEDNIDNIEILFENEEIQKIYIYKYNDYELVDSLTVVREDDKLFIIFQNPWRKIEISKLNVIDNQVQCESESQKFTYPLDVNNRMYQILIDIINHQKLKTQNT